MTSQTSAQGVTSFTSDAYQQQVTAGTSSYGYDGLGRLLTAGTPSSPVSLTYSGMGDQVASDPSATYSRDPSGSVTGVDTTAGVKTIALTDQHMDLSGMLTPAGTALAGSSTFDPWGNVLASTGSAVQAGFQGGWTDPVTHLVHMGARFYDPAAGQFLNQDPVTTPAQGDPAAGGDLHAYVNDSPVTGTDPSGHMATAMIGGGGCASAACAAANNRAVAPKPAPKPCGWFSVCGLRKAVAKGKAVLATVKKVATRTIAAVKKLPVIGRVAAVAISAVSDICHVGVTFMTRDVLPIARAAAGLGGIAISLVATAYRHRAAIAAWLKPGATAKAAASFTKKHPAVAGGRRQRSTDRLLEPSRIPPRRLQPHPARPQLHRRVAFICHALRLPFVSLLTWPPP